MKTQTIASVFVFVLSSVIILGCAPTAKAPSDLSDTPVAEETGMPTGAKAIFESGYGPTVKMSATSPEPTKSKPTRKAIINKPARETYMGVSYWVDLVGSNGQMRRVASSRTFHDGDRIKISLISNRDGYLYLINQGSTGRTNVLFPYGGKDNLIQAHAPYTVPYDTHIRFDSNPGEEILWVFLSPYPLGSREASISAPSGSSEIVTAAAQYGCKDLVLDNADELARVRDKCGAKDLILENDAQGPQPASYVVAPVSLLKQGGPIISLKIKLNHR